MQTSGPSATTVWERICKNKQPVVEPKESALFNQANEVNITILLYSLHVLTFDLQG